MPPEDVQFNHLWQELPESVRNKTPRLTPTVDAMIDTLYTDVKQDIENKLADAICDYVANLAILNGCIPELAERPEIRSFAVSYTSLTGNQADVRTFSVSIK